MEATNTNGHSEKHVVGRDQRLGRFDRERPVVRRTVGSRAAEVEAVLEALADGRTIQDRVMDRVVDRLLIDVQ